MLKDMLVDIVKSLLKFLAALAIPVVLIFVGALIAGVGLKFETMIVVGAGGVVAVAGVLWGVVLVLFHTDT